MRPKRQKVVLAFLGSVLLHGIALTIFAVLVSMRPPAEPDRPPDEPEKLEVVEEDPTPTPPPVPDVLAVPTPTPDKKTVVDATGIDTDSPPPPDAALSDRTTRASSAQAGENAKPGTTQAGQKMASFQFDPRPPAPGLLDRNTVSTPPPATAPSLPKPDLAAHRPAATPRLTAATPPPEATPAPTAAPDEFAMAMATPTPTPEDPFDPSIRSTSPPLPKPATKPVAKSTPAVIGATRSAENGSSANRGPNGVDTSATPKGRYTNKIGSMIKFIWNRSIDGRRDVSYGSVVIHFTIDRDGLVLAPHVAQNTADPMFASTAYQAVVVARLPPMPDDVVTELNGKNLPVDITFELTPMPQEAALH